MLEPKCNVRENDANLILGNTHTHTHTHTHTPNKGLKGKL